jgi:hypothetical protein
MTTTTTHAAKPPTLQVEGPRKPCAACQRLAREGEPKDKKVGVDDVVGGEDKKKEQCVWYEHEGEICDLAVETLCLVGSTNGKVRFACYKRITEILYGHRGWKNRVELPACVVDNIRNAFPEKTYKCFRPASPVKDVM